jgi:hypothetical protein
LSFPKISELLNFQVPVVEGGFGRVTGSYWYSQPSARKFAAFLSIPYAQPPIGNLRYSFLKGQCHEIFDYRFFFHESVSPKPLRIPFRSFRIFSKTRGDIRSSRCTTGVVESLTPMANLPRVSLVPVVHLYLRISPRIFEKIRSDPIVIFGVLGEDDLINDKNLKQKIS